MAYGTTVSWSPTGRRSSPKRMLSSQKVCSCLLLFPPSSYYSHSQTMLSPFLIAPCLPAFSQVLSGLWDENEADAVVNPRQFYNLFKEAVPYFSGYRWEYRWCFCLPQGQLHLPMRHFCASDVIGVQRQCIEIAACNSDRKKTYLCISVFNPVNRMHKSSSGSYWTSCTQKSTAGPSLDEQGRSPNRNMPDLGVYVYVETIKSLKLSRRSSVHILFSLSSCHLFSSLRISEEAAAMWKKHLERDDSKIVGEDSHPVLSVF